MRKSKLIAFGTINACLMYLLYPCFGVLKVLNDFYGVLFTFVYMIVLIIHIAINVFICFRTYKQDKQAPSSWRYIIIGVIIGSICTIIALLGISATSEFQRYIYLNSTIPFRITYIDDLSYFLFVMVYILFIYEMSNKIYRHINKSTSR